MKAEVGDRIVVASGTLHRPIRDGEILQTGSAGGGPYLVRWSDSGNESLFFSFHGRPCRACPGGGRRRRRTAEFADIAHPADKEVDSRHLPLRRSGLNFCERRPAP